MESLFDALYAYAMANRFDTYSLRDQEERQETEKNAPNRHGRAGNPGHERRRAANQGRLSILHFLNQRGAFWAGLNIGLEMHQL